MKDWAWIPYVAFGIAAGTVLAMALWPNSEDRKPKKPKKK